MNIRKFRTEIAALVRDVRSTISPEYRASEDDDTPSIQLTVAADRTGWSFQTGDNSYTGGAYGYRAWAVVSVLRYTNSFECADDIISQLQELGAFDREERS